MPTYDYHCNQCGPFDALRSLVQRNEPCACPVCGKGSERTLLSAPRLSAMASGARAAHETNERSAHAPLQSKDHAGHGARRHPAGCGCCSPGKRGATVIAGNGAKAFPTKRPWMISH
ncbi:FmdB family zinc ribbon protein [Noviherbaspirillum sp. Root189]|uniref:FmdB family zinc ribbon protein n=1 Tax=Noviherbaspirillum sp. Root189 TaxID=1736487 RepID=UPI00070C1A51|nr:zinc ribbon domain-containing protein [Noviherbaspirillum sp. Root189]KRB67969.1 FmdB family transcriptional regulator [Noviherbaspirillum sp. Root189]